MNRPPSPVPSPSPPAPPSCRRRRARDGGDRTVRRHRSIDLPRHLPLWRIR